MPKRSSPTLEIGQLAMMLKSRLSQFEVISSGVLHKPSGSLTEFKDDCQISIRSGDGATSSMLSAPEAHTLMVALDTWRNEYWIPREVHRQFGRVGREPWSIAGWWRRRAARRYLMTGETALEIYGLAWSGTDPSQRGNDPEPPPSSPPQPRSPLHPNSGSFLADRHLVAEDA